MNLQRTLVNAHCLQAIDMLQQTGQEVLPILLGVLGPSFLCQCQCTGEYHVLHLCFRGNPFTPDIALHTFDQCQLLRCQVGRHDVARI